MGIEQLYAAYRAVGLTCDDFLGAKYQRIERIRELLAASRLTSDLRWLSADDHPSETARVRR